MLQEYIQSFTDLTEKAIGAYPANITNRVIIFLFIKNLYNHNIQKMHSVLCCIRCNRVEIPLQYKLTH